MGERQQWIVPTALSAALALVGLAYVKRDFFKRGQNRNADDTDPPLLKKNSTFESYTTSGFTYPKIRTFYHEQPKANELPNDLPLLVFIHGLGGSVAQFAPLLTSLVNLAPCLAIDLPGCGRSDFAPDDDDAFTPTAFAELLFAAIDKYRKKDVNQRVVLFGHSMGCSIAALLASSSSPLAHLCSQQVLGMIAICPRSTAPSEEHLRSMERVQWLWSPLFDMLRLFDRRGGANSASVSRVVGKDADYETRKLQLRFNQQSSSATFQKILKGIWLQEKACRANDEDSLLGRRIWSGMKLPLFLVTAENDALAPPKEVKQIEEWLTGVSLDHNTRRNDSKTASSNLDESESQSSSNTVRGKMMDSVAAKTLPGATTSTTDADVTAASTTTDNQPESSEPAIPAVAGDTQGIQQQLSTHRPVQLSEQHADDTPAAVETEHEASKHSFALKVAIFNDESASHALLYSTRDVRILAGYIEDFMARRIDERLSPGWQLQHLTKTNKWDVKNLRKWQDVDRCSEPMGGIFRAMKTMREIDDVHNPKQFVKDFGWRARPDGVAMVIDISHDTPVYDKNGLEEGGVEYHKFPTVSKMPPTKDEVEQFNDLVDTLRRSPKIADAADGERRATIAVHCHYGFNRTGFFIVGYLIEREGWGMDQALDEFKAKRPPGIKHDWFVHTLATRYQGVQRRATIVG